MKSRSLNEIKIYFKQKNRSVSDLLVFLILKSKIKNDFTCEPLITNDDGILILTEQFFEDTISSYKSSFPMDYAGSLKDCNSLGVLIENRAELDERIERLNNYYPSDAQSLREKVENSFSHDFNFYKEIKMPLKKVKIIINL